MTQVTPHETRLINGYYENHPERRKDPPPKSNYALGEPPSYFKSDEKKVWRELTKHIADGLLTDPDTYIVETFVLLAAKQRRREEMRGLDFGTLLACIGKLGLSPVDRMRLAQPLSKDKEFDDFNEF